MKILPIVSLRQALTDPKYFGQQLDAPSWDAWKALLLGSIENAILNWAKPR